MTSWYRRVALFAAWLGLGLLAPAQSYVPTPVGAARMPEPLRYKPEPQPPLVPGPISPLVAPMGPPPSLDLPATHSSAFQCENYSPECAAFFHVGGMALQRYRLTSSPLIFLDPESVVPGATTLNVGNGTTRQMNVVGLDTGREPFRAPLVFDLKDLHPDMRGGVRATAGWLWYAQAVELTGFYIFANSDAETYAGRGLLTLPFNAASGNRFPLGFEGNNGLWRQADLARVTYLNEIGGAELNYRRWNSGISHVELILGARYLFEREQVSIYTDDEFFIRDRFGNPDPRRAASYLVSSRNNFVGAQVGGEYSFPCTLPCMGWMWFTGVGKAAVGPNFIRRQWELIRGDGRSAFSTSDNSIRIGQVYEMSGFVDMHLLERVRLRAGYTAMWLVGFSAAASQIEFNLNSQGTRPVDYGSQFWHGPVAELQFLF